MTVKDLMQLLSQCPGDLEVYIRVEEEEEDFFRSPNFVASATDVEL